MSTVREKLSAAKKEIESKAKIKFARESIALADLISEFIAIKVDAQRNEQKTPAQTSQSPIATSTESGDDKIDPFYLD